MLFSAQISPLLNRPPRLSIAALLLSTILPSCKPSTSPATTSPSPPSPVTVATPIAQRVIDWDEFTGRLASREQVDVRAQVSGYLTQVSFTEGAEVKTGDLLFTIDPRPFEASVQRAEAVLAEAKALAELAAIQAKNAEGLRIIRKGLSPNERIIVEGLMAVRNGMPVQPKEVDMKLASPQPVPETSAGSDAKTPPAPK